MSSTDSTINQINTAVTTIVLSLSIINFIFGGIGLIFNVLIFTRPSLRGEPCSLYFLFSTYFNLFFIFVIVPVRVVSEGFNLDLANFNLVICKTELFTFYVARTIPCCISYLYDRFGNLTPACYGQKGIYRTFIALWAMLLYSLCPSLIMLVFGSLTLNNLRRHREVIPMVPRNNHTIRRTDAQLSRMLALQVLVIVISTLPFSIYRLYASFTVNITKDPLRLAIENLAFEIANMLTQFAHSTSFYLYTLTGTIFRKEFYKIIRRHRHQNRIGFTKAPDGTHQISIMPNHR
ncbi:unnamed protein product [Adineta steineri]|uniref:G-protein coupled receptors family 1 profile domain-containing protein n=4 Tax=Adineta steineri TaxID=433720 RepID=A0A815GHX1_9BILA|nr:unnamed protein product [Adineta steineri]